MQDNLSCDRVVMVPPIELAFNQETARTNFFSSNIDQKSDTYYQAEFHQLKHNIEKNHIPALQLDYTPDENNPTPDAVFPNNWFTLHKQSNHTYPLVLYPMLTKNRQAEVREALLLKLLEINDIEVSNVIDLRKEAKLGEALEGTGSLILDRANCVAYAARSPRTSERLFNIFCQQLGYTPVIFDAADENSRQIYHTNVMMSIGNQFCLVCLDAIQDHTEKECVLNSLKNTNKEIVTISLSQIGEMCGNILELTNTNGHQKILLSQRAYQGFTKAQKDQLSQFADLIPTDISHIENISGGSVRCMLARVPNVIDNINKLDKK